MSECFSILAMAVVAACGGGQSSSSLNDLSAQSTSTSASTIDDSQLAATTAAIAAAVLAAAPTTSNVVGAVTASALDSSADPMLALRVADAFRSSKLHTGDLPPTQPSTPTPPQPQISSLDTGGSPSPSPKPTPIPPPTPALASPPSSPPPSAPPPSSVDVVIIAAAPLPLSGQGASPPTWSRIATENQIFLLSGSAVVRYGKGSTWITKTASGKVTCSNTFFGTDPLLGTVKECDLQTSALGLATPPITTMPPIDASKIPVPASGFSGPRVKAANVADISQVPRQDGIGAFREPCDFSHMSFDDPIVFPGQPGKSHLHVFFGNTGTNAYTTAASLANSGNSTCAGGTLNRTAYWVPAMIDTRTGAPVKPSSSIFYYKTGYNGIDPKTVQPLPAGLRMISGDPMNSQPSGPFVYGCVGGGNDYWAGQGIPNCAVGQDMLMAVTFPQCWDGVNLDSPDHISHMANPSNGKCPATHPVPVPVVAFDVHYTIKPSDAPSMWRLSSDAYDPSMPGGYSGHADWFNGWDPATMSTFVQNCERKSLDCHAYLLGDGQTLY